jgi:hypothetical protein
MTIQGSEAHDYRGGLGDLLGWRSSGSGTKSTNTRSSHEPAGPQAPAPSQYTESSQYTSNEVPTPVQLDGTGADTGPTQGNADGNTK